MNLRTAAIALTTTGLLLAGTSTATAADPYPTSLRVQAHDQVTASDQHIADYDAEPWILVSDVDSRQVTFGSDLFQYAPQLASVVHGSVSVWKGGKRIRKPAATVTLPTGSYTVVMRLSYLILDRVVNRRIIVRTYVAGSDTVCPTVRGLARCTA